MKKLFLPIVLILITGLNAQSISITPHETSLSDTLGSEMIFAVDVTNISDAEQTIYIVRTINDLPSVWTSSLCFDVCFSPELDSVITTVPYGSSPLLPSETREISVHVFPLENNGWGNVQIKVGSTSDTVSFTIDVIATVEPTSANDNTYKLNKYKLLQNYPNPFNPDTKIDFSLALNSKVILKIFDVLGQECVTLINENLSSGSHSFNFNADGLNTGIYFYIIEATGSDGTNFISTKKMILMK